MTKSSKYNPVLIGLMLLACTMQVSVASKQPTWRLYTSPENCPPCRKLEKLLEDSEVQKLVSKFKFEKIEPAKGVVPSSVFPHKSHRREVTPTSSREALLNHLRKGLK